MRYGLRHQYPGEKPSDERECSVHFVESDYMPALAGEQAALKSSVWVFSR